MSTTAPLRTFPITSRGHLQGWAVSTYLQTSTTTPISVTRLPGPLDLISHRALYLHWRATMHCLPCLEKHDLRFVAFTIRARFARNLNSAKQLIIDLSKSHYHHVKNQLKSPSIVRERTIETRHSSLLSIHSAQRQKPLNHHVNVQPSASFRRSNMYF
jgi:hypothetical protein